MTCILFFVKRKLNVIGQSYYTSILVIFEIGHLVMKIKRNMLRLDSLTTLIYENKLCTTKT